MSFAIDMQQLTARAKKQADQVVQKITMELFRSVIVKTPVDTGRARGNWQCSVGVLPAGVKPDATDSTGAQAISAAATVVNKTPTGNIVYLANNLPYIRRLEYGYSKQAPGGMVRVSAMFIANHYKDIARLV